MALAGHRRWWLAAVFLLIIAAGAIYLVLLAPPRLEPLRWDRTQVVSLPPMVMSSPYDSGLVVLRREFGLERLVADAADDYEVLRRIVHWVHGRWQHSGSNRPSRPDPLTILREAAEGQRFRCVEYAIVAAACARALGYPSRVLALKRKDVETAASGAGHVVAEVWLPGLRKWVFVDPQWNAIPENDGIPLNAVEFRRALERDGTGVTIRSRSLSWIGRRQYLRWIAPYLFYLDFAVDQRFFPVRSEGSRRRIMLVPAGARKPKVFQRKYPIGDCIYISNPDLFYPDASRYLQPLPPEPERAKGRGRAPTGPGGGRSALALKPVRTSRSAVTKLAAGAVRW